MKMKALVLPPKKMLETVCSESCRTLINTEFEPIWNNTGRDYTEQELLELVEDVEVLLTSWGSPVITETVLEKAKKLKYIGHAAGTVKNRVPGSIFQRKIGLFSAAPRIAKSVGEYCLAVLLSCLWRFRQLDTQVRRGSWRSGAFGRELHGQTVGLISASSTARAFIELLSPFHVYIKIYDPFLSEEAANRLGAVKVSLEEVMQCPIISVHAPSLPATEHLITAELLDLIPDHAIFINSSRGLVLDEEALVAQLQTGRFMAALDVLIQEPPAPNHPLLALDNVLITPHVAGMTTEGCLTLMYEVVSDILREQKGETTQYMISEKTWNIMA